MKWKVAEAQARFSDVLEVARQEPQVIESDGRPVAVVISAETYARLVELEDQRRSGALHAFLKRCEALRERADLDLVVEPRHVEPDRTPPPFS